MREVEMAAATTGPAFNGCSQAAVLPLEVLQRPIATVSHIDIDDNQAGDGAGHNADASLTASAKPGARLRLSRTSVLKVLPADQGSLVARPNRNDRPASPNIVMDLGVHRDLRVNPPTTLGFPSSYRHARPRHCPNNCHDHGPHRGSAGLRFVLGARRPTRIDWAPTLTGDNGAVATPPDPPPSTSDCANQALLWSPLSLETGGGDREARSGKY